MKHMSILVFILIPFISFSQKVYSVEYSNQSDLKVFVVEYENQCDLKVYKVDYPNQTINSHPLRRHDVHPRREQRDDCSPHGHWQDLL